MMIRRSFFVLLSLALAAATASASNHVDLAKLRDSVQQHITSHYQDRLSQRVSADQLVVTVGSLDPRLKLRECLEPLSMSVREPPQGQGSITVKTSCDKGQRWTIYVPARVEIHAEVAVASRSLSRGHVLTETDLSFELSNTAALGSGHIEDPDRLLGMELQRPMRAGEAFRLSNLAQPEVVKRGDSVIVEAEAGSLLVVAPGKALGNGQVGEQIRVENTQSKRVIDARVVAPGRVRVIL